MKKNNPEEFPDLKMFLLEEQDFDEIIDIAGGHRFDTKFTPVKGKKNADYIFKDTIIELKLINDEGLEKSERQKKLAHLFETEETQHPVVIIHPELLKENQIRKYYEILENPFKSHIRKAAEQLSDTANIVGLNSNKVLLLFNNGYTTLSPEEFERIALHRVKNYSKDIDFLVTAGLYFYGDGFDFFPMPIFTLHQINIEKTWQDFTVFQDAWNDWFEGKMTALITNPNSLKLKKQSVNDLVFRLDEKIYIKPCPKLNNTSEFYVHGRPRKNTSVLRKATAVAEIHPKLTQDVWQKIYLADIDDALRGSYGEHCKWLNNLINTEQTIVLPYLSMPFEWDGFQTYLGAGVPITYASLCYYVTNLFNKEMKLIINSAMSFQEKNIEPIQYMYLSVKEIGRDKAYDLASLYFVSNYLEPPTQKTIFKNQKIYFEYGLPLSAAYAIKYGCSSIVYNVDKTYGWE